jgi:hypothetical protein
VVASDVPAGWVERLRDPSLTALLIMQFLVIFVAAPLGSLGLPPPSLVAVSIVAGLLVILVLVSRSKAGIIGVLIAALLALTGAILRRSHPSLPTEVLGHGAAILALVAVSIVVAQAVFAPGRITHHRIQGAIVLYLNLAMIFTAAYRLVSELSPGAFSNLPAANTDVGEWSMMLYFSITTLTSTGFGDILPLHPLARSLCNLEAIIGQIFPATLLARIVTLQWEDRRR